MRTSDSKLLFSTYLGGSKINGAYSVALDSAGNPIVSGVTDSADFATTHSAFQPRRRGSTDASVTKLSAAGSRIVWFTYYGGSRSNSDQYLGGGLAVDKVGRVWFTGMTNSADLPTRNASQASFGGGDFDGFLAAFSPDGSTLDYGSYVGGNAHDILEGLAIGRGVVYTSGLSSSTKLEQKKSQIQPRYGGGLYDAFFTRLNTHAVAPQQ